MKATVIILALFLGGCANFNLGALAYCPAKHDCKLEVKK